MNGAALHALAPARVIRPRRCETCQFAMVAGRGINCHRNPPAAHVLPGAGGQPVPISVFPPVQADQFCGEWKAKIEGVQ